MAADNHVHSRIRFMTGAMITDVTSGLPSTSWWIIGSHVQILKDYFRLSNIRESSNDPIKEFILHDINWKKTWIQLFCLTDLPQDLKILTSFWRYLLLQQRCSSGKLDLFRLCCTEVLEVVVLSSIMLFGSLQSTLNRLLIGRSYGRVWPSSSRIQRCLRICCCGSRDLCGLSEHCLKGRTFQSSTCMTV
jgi:hypothetical protein